MRLAWLMLLPLAACSLEWDSDPNAPVKPLSALPDPTLWISADMRQLGMTIRIDAFSAKACPVLDDSFTADINGVPLMIMERGASIASIFSSEPCSWPRLELANPPAAATAVIALHYPDHSVSVDLLDRLTPRSAQPVPAGPWAFTPGQMVTLQWSPASDLTTYMPSLVLLITDGPQNGVREAIPRDIAGDRMTFRMSVTTSPAQLQVTLLDDKMSDADRLHCVDASCVLIQTPTLVQPITWLPTP